MPRYRLTTYPEDGVSQRGHLWVYASDRRKAASFAVAEVERQRTWRQPGHKPSGWSLATSGSPYGPGTTFATGTENGITWMASEAATRARRGRTT